MTPPFKSRPNPTGKRRRVHRRHYRGLSDEQQRTVFQQQRGAIVAIFDAMEEYFCADLDARLESLDAAISDHLEADRPGEINAEFSE